MNAKLIQRSCNQTFSRTKKRIFVFVEHYLRSCSCLSKQIQTLNVFSTGHWHITLELLLQTSILFAQTFLNNFQASANLTQSIFIWIRNIFFPIEWSVNLSKNHKWSDFTVDAILKTLKMLSCIISTFFIQITSKLQSICLFCAFSNHFVFTEVMVGCKWSRELAYVELPLWLHWRLLQ